jgi:hypothetical protein
MPSRILRLWNPNTTSWEEVGDSRLTTHLAAADPHPGYLLESLVDAKGDLLGASADNTPARLAVGTDGQVLTADGAQLLGVRWATPSWLPLAGGTLTGDLVLSEATPTVSLKQAADTQPRSRLSDTALAFGPGGTTAPDTTLTRTGAQQLALNSSLTVTPAAGQPALAARSDAGVVLQDAAPTHSWTFAPISTGTTLRLRYDATDRMTVGATGSVTLSPDVGQPHLVAAAGTNLILRTPAAGSVALGEGGTDKVAYYANQFYPVTDNQVSLGLASLRWTTVYAVAGAINTSSADQKTAITPLDPAAAMTAVRNTTPCTFDYLPPEREASWYELPDDPEQAEAVLYQRLVSGPLEAAARHQQGVVLDDPAHPCDPLFRTGEGQTNPSNSVGVLLAALKQVDTRLTALGG